MLIFILPFLISLCFAAGPIILDSSFSQSKTSDELNLKKFILSFANNRRDLFWNYTGEKEVAFDYGVHIERTDGEYKEQLSFYRYQAFVGQKWSFNHYSKFDFGNSLLRYNDKAYSLDHYGFTHLYKREWLNFTLNYLYDFYFLEQGVPGSLEEELKYHNLNLSAVFIPHKEFRIPLHYSQKSISDGHSAVNMSLDVLYGRVYPTWIWVGYGIGELKYNEESSLYWSPEKFFSHGPRFELSYGLSDKLVAKFNVNYNIIKEGSFPSGESYYMVSALEWGDRNTTLLGVSFNRIQSEQNSNLWWSEEIKLYLKHSF